MQEKECVDSEDDFEVSDDDIDGISVGIDSDEYDVDNDVWIKALDPLENEVDDVSNGSNVDGIIIMNP